MPIERDDAAHLLRRAWCCATPERIDTICALPSWHAAVEHVTSVGPVHDLPRPDDGPWSQHEHRWNIVRWLLDDIAFGPHPFVNRMTLFWHNHFTFSDVKLTSLHSIWDYLLTLRRHGHGDFETLTQAVAVHPVMLAWLDNADNRLDRTNENFARELMELFLMGNPTYTQDDVLAMTRAWTGHGVTNRFKDYAFRPEHHDHGQKTLFGITRNWDGPEAITEILRGSQAVPASRHICAKLWSYFAYADPEPEYVDQIAATFRSSGLNIAAAVRAIFEHPVFRSPKAYRSLVASPAEWSIAIHGGVGFDHRTARVDASMGRMGQSIIQSPSVDGWGQNRYWLASAFLAARGDWVKGRLVPVLHARLDGIHDLSNDDAIDLVVDTFSLPGVSDWTREQMEVFLNGPNLNRSTIRYLLPLIVTLSPDLMLL